MQFGQAVGTACATFAITNIDDAFVLVTFFAEATTSKTLTPLKITLGQYIGFTIIIIISMIGFGVSLVLPSEPIGFLGLLPILLGIWQLLGFITSTTEDDSEGSNIKGMRSILKVAAITVMNGGDNIGTYIPLFSQVEGAEIAVYVVVYYILLGLWCLFAFLVMKQKHVLWVIQKYVDKLIPLLYMGLGVYIVVKSDCYPWSIEHIDESNPSKPGKPIIAAVTVVFILVFTAIMVWFKMSKKGGHPVEDVEISSVQHQSPIARTQSPDQSHVFQTTGPANNEETS